MSRVDGRRVDSPLTLVADVVVVGSGPAGATAAHRIAREGARVVVIEAGPWIEPDEVEISAFGSMAASYRDMGASVLLGPSVVPFIQGKAVGGSSSINGAICWRMPRDIHDGWVDADPALAGAIGWDELDAATDEVERDLNVGPTDAAIAGRKNELMAAGAEALGLEHRPIRRNVRACVGSGRCMQGCPGGHKLSADRTYVPWAEALGARVASSVTVERILFEGDRAVGVEGRADGGGLVRARAKHAVVLAASAVQTPALLLASGLRRGPVGHFFQCHPGVSIAGRFREPVRMWEGASQGHEVIGLRKEGLKFEALGLPLAVLASRLDGIGADLARGIDEMAHWADWGVAVRATGMGRVRSVLGRPIVTFVPSARDARLFRRGLRVLGEMLFAAGAERVSPGVFGFDESVEDPRRLRDLEENGPSYPHAFQSVVTHMFGTCRMGSDPDASVVRPDFRTHEREGLYVADSSIFPTNTGVNPQIAMMAMAALAAKRVVGAMS